MKILCHLLIALALCLLSAAANAATCFWVGGTGNYDSVNTASWASSSGGTAGTCAATGSIPKNAGDIATFDASSGGGIVTVCGALSSTCPSGTGTLNLATITAGAFTGTLDFSAINPNVTATTSINFSGSGTRTINCGSGTFTLSGTGTIFDNGTNTGETFSCSSATIAATSNGSGTNRTIALGTSKSYGTITISAATAGGFLGFTGTSPTITTLNVSGPIHLNFIGGTTSTITNLNVAGTSSNLVLMASGSAIAATVAVTNPSINWSVVDHITFATSAVSPTNSYDLGGNNFNGGTLTNPSTGSGFIIGG